MQQTSRSHRTNRFCGQSATHAESAMMPNQAGLNSGRRRSCADVPHEYGRKQHQTASVGNGSCSPAQPTWSRARPRQPASCRQADGRPQTGSQCALCKSAPHVRQAMHGRPAAIVTPCWCSCMNSTGFSAAAISTVIKQQQQHAPSMARCRHVPSDAASTSSSGRFMALTLLPRSAFAIRQPDCGRTTAPNP